MKSKIWTLFFVFKISFLYCQLEYQNIDSIQGIWHLKNDTLHNYMIIFGNKKLTIANSNTTTYFIRERPFGYIGLKEFEDPLPKKITNLGKSGNNLITYEDTIRGFDLQGNLRKPLYNSMIVFNPDREDETQINTIGIIGANGRPDIYNKIKTLPDIVLIQLKKNKKEWSKYVDFVNMKRKNLSVSKSFIYNNVFEKTKSYLVKNDEVEILQEVDAWFKIRFYGHKIIEGWIRKSDIN